MRVRSLTYERGGGLGAEHEPPVGARDLHEVLCVATSALYVRELPLARRGL